MLAAIINEIELYLTEKEIPELYRKHVREITAFIYHYVRNLEDAKDITQDVFFKVYNEVINRKVQKTNLRAYLYKIARNCCTDLFRKKNVQENTLDESNIISGKAYSHDQVILDSIVIEDIFQFIDKNLSERESSIFKLKFIYNLKLEEISDITDISIATCSRIINAVLKKIQEAFSDIF